LNEGANHFELMDLPVAFAIDGEKLERAYRDLQSRVHPDKFAAGSGAERRVAMQWATRANEAYRTLKDPVARARYLLSLKGFDTGEETNTAMPADFLMEQMELREAAAAARSGRDAAALEALRGTLATGRADMVRLLGRALDAEHNYDAGCSLVRKLRFLDKLDEEVDDALHEMTEEAR
jgi:molecular chaperone HscB